MGIRLRLWLPTRKRVAFLRIQSRSIVLSLGHDDQISGFLVSERTATHIPMEHRVELARGEKKCPRPSSARHQAEEQDLLAVVAGTR